jgi:hypothetical protein
MSWCSWSCYISHYESGFLRNVTALGCLYRANCLLSLEWLFSLFLRQCAHLDAGLQNDCSTNFSGLKCVIAIIDYYQIILRALMVPCCTSKQDCAVSKHAYAASTHSYWQLTSIVALVVPQGVDITITCVYMLCFLMTVPAWRQWYGYPMMTLSRALVLQHRERGDSRLMWRQCVT